MSMIAEFREITPGLLARLKTEPLLTQAVIFPDLATDAGARGSAGPQKLDPSDLGEQVNIDKAWHGLHFLLSGSIEATPDPLGQAVLGGTEIGEDTGYGPARFLDSRSVSGIAEALSDVSAEDLRKRFDASAMSAASIYPDAWDDDAEDADWLLEAYEEVLAFYQGAASRGNAALLYLT